jgi:hypothetical protein
VKTIERIIFRPVELAIVHCLVLWTCLIREINRLFLDFQLGACKALNPSLVQLREQKETATLNFVMP